MAAASDMAPTSRAVTSKDALASDRLHSRWQARLKELTYQQRRARARPASSATRSLAVPRSARPWFGPAGARVAPRGGGPGQPRPQRRHRRAWEVARGRLDRAVPEPRLDLLDRHTLTRERCGVVAAQRVRVRKPLRDASKRGVPAHELRERLLGQRLDFTTACSTGRRARTTWTGARRRLRGARRVRCASGRAARETRAHEAESRARGHSTASTDDRAPRDPLDSVEPTRDPAPRSPPSVNTFARPSTLLLILLTCSTSLTYALEWL